MVPPVVKRGVPMAVRLLLVDDDPWTLQAVSHILEHYLPAITISTCENPVSALSRLRSERFAVVLSDFNMPDMNGLRLLQATRECGSDASFILMTGDSTEGHADGRVTAGPVLLSGQAAEARHVDSASAASH